uniref:DNA mismatch repair protein MutS-like N-terminal domain-containing protein n=1 Tax=Romanomermis culicivorax TaxID=13658 RepID=A0A915KQF2_ROMCU
MTKLKRMLKISGFFLARLGTFFTWTGTAFSGPGPVWDGRPGRPLTRGWPGYQMFDENFANFVGSVLKGSSVTTVCIFDKGEYYMCFERCAQFLAREIFKSNAVMKISPVSGKDDRKLRFMNINKNQFENILRQVLLFYQYRIELYSCLNVKNQDWQLKCTASPGNLAAFEDILLDSGNAESTTVIALKFRQESDKLKILSH